MVGGFRSLGAQSFDTDISYVPSNTSVVSIVSTDASRQMVSIMNASTAVLTILHGGNMDLAAATAAMAAGRKTIDIAAGGYYEVPINYVGPVYGKWAAANGTAELTEYR